MAAGIVFSFILPTNQTKKERYILCEYVCACACACTVLVRVPECVRKL